MNRILILFILIIHSQVIFSQVVNIDGVPILLAAEKDDGLDSNLSVEDLRKIRLKRYLTVSFKPAIIGDKEEVFFIRYNIYEGEMEFTKDDKTYYLKKEVGKTVRFTTHKSTYKVFEYERRLDYFLVQKEGKNSLLVKQIVKYIKPQPAKTSYDEYKPANFLRVKDQYFIAFDNEKLVKIPKKKKNFYNIFGDKSSEIKSFMKKRKLGYKNSSDLGKIVSYYNML